jgi:cysteine desulfurase/selenocysteine lyase
MTDWNKIRQDFPITKNCTYFMSAAMSPLPRPVFDRLTAEYRTLVEDGDIHWSENMSTYQALCRDLALHLGSGPEDLTFAPNSSTAMALLGLSLQKHGPADFNLVTLQDEFPASTVPFEHLGIPLRCAQPVGGRYALSSILDQADGNTLAVVASQVQYATGFRLDIARLGRELARRGILFLVNATQAFPYYPLDVKAMHISALTASLHKWGLTGHLGALFCTAPSFRERFPTPLAGWLSVDTEGAGFIHTAKNVPFKLHSSARQYELGTFNLQPLLAFQEAFHYLQRIGFEAIRLRLRDLTDHLLQGLRRLGVAVISPVDNPEERSAIVSFTLGDRNELCLKRCTEARIYLSPRAGFLRVSANIFNSPADIDRLLDVLQEIKQSG